MTILINTSLNVSYTLYNFENCAINNCNVIFYECSEEVLEYNAKARQIYKEIFI